jgi:3-hydroxyisobutyrate dehydrogenase-like beta-hydroxyacid dehydrogenase
MGARIAGRLLDAGHDVVVWNRTATKADPLVELGAVAAASPAEAAEGAEAVITMVADPAALSDVTEGPTGVAAGAADGTTVVQVSTVSPAAIKRLATVLGPRSQLLDAPVLGSLTEVETGTLTIFTGGPAELVEHWRPLLSDLGSVLHVGPLGAGTAAKLVANTTLIGVLGVLGEALALADGMGIARNAAFGVLAATPLGAQAKRRRVAIESGDYPRRFALSLARKDADLILEAAAAAGVDLRVTAAAGTWFTEADQAGRGDEDYSTVLAHIAGDGEGGPPGRPRVG